MIKNAERIAVFGRSGSGKSTFVKNLIKNDQRLIIFDTQEEYNLKKCYSLPEVLKAVKQKPLNFKLSYVPQGVDSYPKHLHALSKLIFAINAPYKQGLSSSLLTFVVEELNQSYPVHNLKANLTGFRDVCSRGRHFGIRLIGVSQRYAEVNKNFTENCTTSVFFAQGVLDIDNANKALGGGCMEKLQSLKPHYFLSIDQKHQIREGKNKIG